MANLLPPAADLEPAPFMGLSVLALPRLGDLLGRVSWAAETVREPILAMPTRRLVATGSIALGMFR